MTTHPTPEALAEPEQLTAKLMAVHKWHSDGQPTTFSEAADLIRTLSAELAAARAEAATERALSFRDQVAQLEAERDSLRAEVERLRPKWEPIETATEEDEKNHQAWLLVDGAVVRGYYIEIPFQEYRDGDGFWLGQQDADAYWARAEDGEPVGPTHFQRILPPAPPVAEGV